jgi:hypothetical protein
MIPFFIGFFVGYAVALFAGGFIRLHRYAGDEK